MVNKIADNILISILFLGMILNLFLSTAQNDIHILSVISHVTGMVGCILGLVYLLIKDHYRK